MGEEVVTLDPLLAFAQQRYLLTLPSEFVPNKQEIIASLETQIKQNNMAPYYESLCKELGWSVDDMLSDRMQQHNQEELKTLDEKLKDAQENLGESEVREALLAKALFFSRIGDKERAESAYRLTYEKTVPLGQRLDIVFSLIRLGLAFGDPSLVKRNIEKAKSLVEEGGDWERRNRLKVYEGVFFTSVRNFKKAAHLFLDSIATFSSAELVSYNAFIKYTVLMSIASLDRKDLKNRVVNTSEILTVIGEIPHLSALLNSLYNCCYRDFFIALANIYDDIVRDRFLGPHVQFYYRELRIIAYTQFLESYRSVTLENMANNFGVSTKFLDMELSRFISAGRLNCKIDLVGSVVETNRPDSKNAMYQASIKQGDLLLNKIQKLARAIEM